MPEPNSGCWLWIDAPDSHGYGVLQTGKRTSIKAHRLSHILHKGPVPRGKLVCHHCDNTICVNPEHIYAGTSKQNNEDMHRRGRHRPSRNGLFGESQHTAVLTDASATEALQLLLVERVNPAIVATRFGVGRTTMQKLRDGLTWRHLPRP